MSSMLGEGLKHEGPALVKDVPGGGIKSGVEGIELAKAVKGCGGGSGVATAFGMEGEGEGGKSLEVARKGFPEENHRLRKLVEDADEVAGLKVPEGGVEEVPIGILLLKEDPRGSKTGKEAGLAIAGTNAAGTAVEPVVEGGPFGIGEVVVPSFSEDMGPELRDEARGYVVVLRDSSGDGLAKDREEPKPRRRDPR